MVFIVFSRTTMKLGASEVAPRAKVPSGSQAWPPACNPQNAYVKGREPTPARCPPPSIYGLRCYITYEETRIHLTPDLNHSTKGRWQWRNIFKMLKEIILKPRILYQQQHPFIYKHVIKLFYARTQRWCKYLFGNTPEKAFQPGTQSIQQCCIT